MKRESTGPFQVLRSFPDRETARAFARRLVPDHHAGWRDVWRSPTGHILKVEEHPTGIGIIYYRNGDADVYRGRFPV